MNRLNPPFHLAIPVLEIHSTRDFYESLLGCEVGRKSETWIDFDFFGHQLSAHVMPEEVSLVRTSDVDGKEVPVRHFGVVLDWKSWEALSKELERKKVTFLIPPCIRFKGTCGEQGTFFIKDPSGNVLEFKSFNDMENLFRED